MKEEVFVHKDDAASGLRRDQESRPADEDGRSACDRLWEMAVKRYPDDLTGRERAAYMIGGQDEWLRQRAAKP